MEKIYTKATIEKATSADFVAVASTGIVDRHGEVVSPEGWDIKAFKKNPVLLWGHDHYEMAVGKATKVWIEGTGKRAKLMIEGVIHEATEKARALKQLVADGIISTMSVGFRPIEMDGDTFVQQELLEVSFVNVPANNQAMITAYKSLSDAGIDKKTMSEVGIPVYLLDELDNLEQRVKNMEDWAKVHNTSTASLGRTTKVQRERLAMAKIVAKATDNLLKQEKVGVQNPNRTKLLKVIKRANNNLIVSHKEQINGKNQGAT